MKKKGQRPWSQSLRISPPINPRPQRGQWLCSRAGCSAPSSPVPSLAPRASGSRGPRATTMSQPSALVGGELDGNVSSILAQGRFFFFFFFFLFFFKRSVRSVKGSWNGESPRLLYWIEPKLTPPPPSLPPPPPPLLRHDCSSFLFLRFLGRS